MTSTHQAENGVTDTEAWLVFATDVLDVTHDVLERLSPTARAEITTILTESAPDYGDCSNLTERIETALNNLNHN